MDDAFSNLSQTMTQIDEALIKLRAGASADALESHRLEFKQQDPQLKRTLEILTDAVVCLANADGGEIVLGVTDLPGQHGSLQGV